MADPEREVGASAPTVAGRKDASSGLPTVAERPSAPTVPARPSAPTSPDVAPPPLREDPTTSAFDPPVDRFEERDELGRGGMGRVVEAHDRALGRPVAIKYMLAATASDLARFEREARITARLEHPGIVSVHDAGRTRDGTPYYVMRRVDGEPLSEVVARRSARARLTLVPNVLAAADAIAYAHARDVIHRDLKPSNILLGAFGETLVIDWGIARTIGDAHDPASAVASDPELTRAGTVAGTPGFMAPEQARGEALDQRVDVYALGTTLFYVLAGELPFSASGATEMIDLAGAGRTPDWSRLPADTPPDLRAIVAKAMAGDRAARYRDAGELAADLRRFVTGQLVGAHEYGRLEQLRRFVRRHRAAVVVAVVAVAVIVTSSVIFVRRILSERDAATAATELAEQRRREADDRSDLLLVQHAQQLASTDPVGAIAALRRLPVTSRQWRRAATAAALAASHGIPRGISLARSVRGGIEFAPGSRRAALVPIRQASLIAFELPSFDHRVIALPAGATTGTWIDDRTMLLLGAQAEAMLVDMDTAVVRVVAAPGAIEALVSDGRGGAWVHGADHMVRRLDVATGTLGAPIAEGVKWFQRTNETGFAFAVYDDALELWSADARIQLPGNDRWPLYGEGRVAAQLGGRLCTWDVTSTVAVAGPCHTLAQHEAPAAINKTSLFIMSGNTLRAISAAGRSWTLTNELRSLMSTRHGLIVLAADQLRVHDADGMVSVRARSAGYSRLAQSPDRRFLVGHALTGEIFAWDLEAFRPRHLHMKGSRLVGMRGDDVLVVQAGDLYRFDRTTGARSLLDRFEVIEAASESTGTWLVGTHPMLRSVLYHLPTRTQLVSEPRERFSVLGARPYVMGNGAAAWIDLDGRRTPFAAVRGASMFAVSARYAVGLVDERRLCRLRHGATDLTCLDQPGGAAVTSFHVDDRGVVWSLAGGRVWRWSGTGPMVEVRPEGVFRFLHPLGSEMLAIGTDMIVELTGRRSTIAIPAINGVINLSDRRLLGVTLAGTLIVIELEAGAWYELPVEPQLTPTLPYASGNTIAYNDDQGVGLLELSAPTEPAALRAWLATATNAVPVPDSDAVAWPTVASGLP